MKRIFLFCILGIFLTACTYQVKDYPVIKDPNYPRVVVREKEGKLVKETKPQEEKEEITQVGTFYPDPTRGYIENQTYNVFIMIWLDPVFEKGKAKGPPDFNLPPKAIVEAAMSLGEHTAYALGRIKTEQYGWQSIGRANEKFSIDSRGCYDGNYGWYVVFHQGDFKR